MANHLANGPCPHCGSKDNLALYDDGSEWCWGCSWYKPPNIANKIAFRKKGINQQDIPIHLPEDFDPDYIPAVATDWMKQYELDRHDYLQYCLGWSETHQSLIFPIIVNGQLLAYQRRYFGDRKDFPKWITRGKVHQFLYSTLKQGKTVCVVEDLVSAIKLTKVLNLNCCPLFGSQMTLVQKREILKLNPSKFFIWLDRDKAKEAYLLSKQMTDLQINTHVIVHDLDPKEVPAATIKEMFNG